MTLAIFSITFSQDLTPQVLPSGTVYRSDTVKFLFTRAQFESVFVRLNQAKLAREEVVALKGLNTILQANVGLKDSLYILASRRAELWKENYSDALEISKLKQSPWWDHWWMGSLGTVAAILVSVEILKWTGGR